MSVKIILLLGIVILIASSLFLISCVTKASKVNIQNQRPVTSFYDLEAHSIDGNII